jgi:DNA segregation ATPase FtsK/SpoIIIE, S-DNA-T family
MPAVRKSPAPPGPIIGLLPSDLRDSLQRRIQEAGGLVLLGLTLVAVLALATWSVEDPSFNHATSQPPRNLLGVPGAVLADLMMQLFGLAALAVLLPVAFWGWRLLTHRTLDREGLRLAMWAVGALGVAALLSSLPQAPRWPLPVGLGGALGDLVLRLPDLAAGLVGAHAARLGGGLLFGAAGLFAVGVACGFGFHRDETAERAARPGRKVPVHVPPRAMRDDDDDDDRTIVSLGALAHAALSLKARITGLFARREPSRLPRTAEPVFQPPRPATAAPRAVAPVAKAPARPAPAKPAGKGRVEPVAAAPDLVPDDPDIDEAFDDAPFEIEDAPPPPAAKPGKSKVPVIAPARETPKALPPRDMKGRAKPVFNEAEADYDLPALKLLADVKPGDRQKLTIEQIQENAATLEGVLEDFGVRGEIVNARPGPVVTLYELEPAPGIKSSRVIGLSDDIARSMSAVSARVAVVPGRNAIGIELPNPKREKVLLRELLATQDYANASAKLPLCLGKTIGGEAMIVDLARMPHLLIAGTTGSGKSVAINTMILSLLYRLKPSECRLIMVDPKMLELSVYDGIPHLLSPVVTDPKKAVVALKWAVREMEDRYRKMSKLGVRNIDGYNARVVEALQKGETLTRTVQTGFDKETGEAVYEEEALGSEPLPYIVVIVDEMADLMMVAGKEIEGAIQRLAQMARAAGIHVVLATQRPSVDVITGTIKANFPTRISFQVTSKIDSRTILGEQGAEQLLGQGDMLYMAGGGRISRVHGPFCSDEEVEKVVNHLKAQGQPSYLDAVTRDDEPGDGEDGAVFDATAMGAEGGDLYSQAVQIVMRDRKASTSYIQRRLQVGYNKAASLMEKMENEGIVGPANHAGKREILVGGEE